MKTSGLGSVDCLASHMNAEKLSGLLVQRILGWVVTPERFLLPNRKWLPRWRFNPLSRMADAFVLLHAAGATYNLTGNHGHLTAEVKIGDSIGTVTGPPTARTITFAIAQALGLEVSQ